MTAVDAEPGRSASQGLHYGRWHRGPAHDVGAVALAVQDAAPGHFAMRGPMAAGEGPLASDLVTPGTGSLLRFGVRGGPEQDCTQRAPPVRVISMGGTEY